MQFCGSKEPSDILGGLHLAKIHLLNNKEEARPMFAASRVYKKACFNLALLVLKTQFNVQLVDSAFLLTLAKDTLVEQLRGSKDALVCSE